MQQTETIALKLLKKFFPLKKQFFHPWNLNHSLNNFEAGINKDAVIELLKNVLVNIS